MTSERQKAVEQMRRSWEAWRVLEESGATSGLPIGRFMRTSGKAGTALLRVVCADLDDPCPRFAYGEIAGLRSRLMARVRGRTSAAAALNAARGALWGLYGAELNGGDPDRMAPLLAEPPIETDFTTASHLAGVIYGERRLAAAADARVALAERLQASGRPPPKDAMIPQQIDATLRARGKYHRLDETMLWQCQLASCHGFDSDEEAAVLVTEATAAYRFLADQGSQLGPEDVAEAERRRDAVLARLRHS